MVSHRLFVCQGVKTRDWGDDDYRFFYVLGHSYRPSEQEQGYYGGDRQIRPANEIGSVDMTNYWPGHTSWMGLWRVTGPYGGGTIYQSWGDPNGVNRFTVSWSVPSLGSDYWYAGWIFWYVISGAIDMNGTWNVESYLTNGGGFQNRDITVSNLDTSKFNYLGSRRGAIWVDGEDICFISNSSLKQKLVNDGGNYGTVGLSKSGYIWIPTGTGLKYIEFISETGIHRRTKNGDMYDNNYTGNPQLPQSAPIDKKGSIWCNENINIFNLFFVADNGQIIRVSNGSISGNWY